ncbi:MAG: helix-turn-helix domain-containing protein [Brasilonema octagenarum HA4186-MV1]|nr:helix-turn-helix domain-containing protein [Brasilonema octagenarum HA4186-MV1]
MPKLVTIQPHMRVEELEQRYRECSDVVESRHYQIIWLLAKGKTTAELAEVTGYSRGCIRRLARHYNQQGAFALCANAPCLGKMTETILDFRF